MAVGQELGGRALKNHVAAVFARPQTQIDHVVGRANRFLVVLDDDDGVAEIAQPGQRRQECAIVALMKTDGRLVEDVEHASEIRANLGGQANALSLAARQRRCAPAERQIPDTDVVEKMQAVANLTKNPARDQRFAIAQLLLVEDADRFGNGQIDVLGNRPPLDAHGAALRLQPFPAAGRAGTQRAIRFEVFLLDPRSLFVPSPEIGNKPLEPGAKRILRRLTLRLLALRIGFRSSSGAWRAKQQDVAQLFGQPAERQREVDPEGPAERGQRFANQLLVALGPGSDGAFLQRQRLIRHQPRRIEVVYRAQALALRAGAVRRVERERARRHLRHADAAVGAGQPP